MASSQRETRIDICKGIAITLVVIGHVIASYHNTGLLKDAVFFNYVGIFVYSFHMPLFMMISWFVV